MSKGRITGIIKSTSSGEIRKRIRNYLKCNEIFLLKINSPAPKIKNR